MPIIIDPSPSPSAEGFILDPNSSNPLNLGNMGSLRLSELNLQFAPKRPEWVINADVDGTVLARKPYRDNRQCSFKVRAVVPNMDAGMNAIGVLQQKLALADDSAGGPILGSSGLAFLWTPANASVGLTGYILFAEIADVPITYDSGWFAQSPLITVNFTCRPFLYGAEITGPTTTSTAPLVTIDVPDVPGDVSAEARLVITDGSSQARRWVEWGLEQHYYNPSSPWPLLIDSEDLVISGFGGVQVVRTGGYRRSGATHDTIGATLLTQPIAVCGTGNQSHVGVFRVKARVWATSISQYWRLTWQSGDGPLTSNSWVQPVAASDFSELDLGLIDIEPTETGSQKWTGRIEAYTLTRGDVGEVDYLTLYPVTENGYGRVEAAYSYNTGLVTEYDDFTGVTGGTVLNGRAAPLGGSWGTSGPTTDFVGDATVYPGTEVRSTTVAETSPRIAFLGSSAMTNIEVNVGVLTTAPGFNQSRVFARYVLGSYVFVEVGADSAVRLGSVISGVTSEYAKVTIPAISASAWYKLRLIVYATGRMLGWLLDANGGTIAGPLEYNTSILATSGSLASGTAGFSDQSWGSLSSSRHYDNFYVSTPAAEPLSINSGRSLEITSSENRRWSTDGSSYGDIASRGSRLFIPQAGDAGRTSRIAVRATREDPISAASRNDGDSLTVATYYTPRYLVVPRS